MQYHLIIKTGIFYSTCIHYDLWRGWDQTLYANFYVQWHIMKAAFDGLELFNVDEVTVCNISTEIIINAYKIIYSYIFQLIITTCLEVWIQLRCPRNPKVNATIIYNFIMGSIKSFNQETL